MASQRTSLPPSLHLYTCDFHRRVSLFFVILLLCFGQGEEVVGGFYLKFPDLFFDGFVKILNFASWVLFIPRLASWVFEVKG